MDTVVAFLPLCGVDGETVFVRVRLRLRISGQIIDKRRIYIYDIAALRIGSFRQDVPYRVVIRPVDGTGVLLPDIEALADQIMDHGTRPLEDQISSSKFSCPGAALPPSFTVLVKGSSYRVSLYV